MQATFRYSKIMMLFMSIMMILAGIFVTHNSILIELFYLVYSLLIYLYFSKDIKRYAYFLMLLYAATTSGNSKYVYVFMFIYFLIVLKRFYENKFRVEKFEHKKNVKYYIFFFVFLIYLVLSLFIAKDKNLAINYLIRYAIVLSIFTVVFLENNTLNKVKETLKYFLFLYIGILVLGTIELFGINYGLPNIFGDKGITYDFVKRIPEVFYYNPNNYSVVLNLGVASLFISLLFTKEKKKRRFFSLLILISEIQIIFAQSRISWIVLILTFLFTLSIGIFDKKEEKVFRKSIIKTSSKAIVLTLVLFFSMSIIPSMKPYYGKIADSIFIKKVQNVLLKYEGDEDATKAIPKIEIGEKGSENERVTLMYNVVNGVIVEKNYLGFGVGNIGLYIKEKSNTFGITNIHSFWFEYLGDFGLPMFLYLISMYCAMMLDYLKLYRMYLFKAKKYFFMFLCITFILVFSAFAPSTVMMFSPFWIVLGISFSLVSNKLNYKSL